MIYFGIVYTINNLIQTKLYERRVYPFMDWKSYDSLVAFFVILVVQALMYFTISTISKKFAAEASVASTKKKSE